jgi:hypothetical protein
MTEVDQIPPYHMPPTRPAIQVQRHEKKDWLVWNWETNSWDVMDGPVTAEFRS